MVTLVGVGREDDGEAQVVVAGWGGKGRWRGERGGPDGMGRKDDGEGG